VMLSFDIITVSRGNRCHIFANFVAASVLRGGRRGEWEAYDIVIKDPHISCISAILLKQIRLRRDSEPVGFVTNGSNIFLLLGPGSWWECHNINFLFLLHL